MVRWDEPDSNHADILRYRVTLLQSDGNYSEETLYCDASAVLIRLQRFCLIRHSVLTQEPFSLTYDTLIQAKIEAFNRNGWSDPSDPNEASLLQDRIQTVPTVPTTLISGSLTNVQQIELEW